MFWVWACIHDCIKVDVRNAVEIQCMVTTQYNVFPWDHSRRVCVGGGGGDCVFRADINSSGKQYPIITF